MSLINQYVQALREFKGNSPQSIPLSVNNEEFRRRAEQFEREYILRESSQFTTNTQEDDEGDGGDNQINIPQVSVVNLYEYTNNASITGMIIDFSSSADVNIFNDTFTLNETITSNQSFDFIL